jgi:hypothetical protein
MYEDDTLPEASQLLSRPMQHQATTFGAEFGAAGWHRRFPAQPEDTPLKLLLFGASRH